MPSSSRITDRNGTRADGDLVGRARTGDREAFGALVRRYQGPLFRFLTIRVGNAHEAEEFAQDAFLAAYERLARYDSQWSFKTWLFTLGRRIAISGKRRRRPGCASDDVIEGLASSDDPARTAIAREDRVQLWDIVCRELTSDQRSVLWLRYGEGLGVAAVARVLAKREGTTRVLLHRARKALAGHLAAGLDLEPGFESGFVPGFEPGREANLGRSGAGEYPRVPELTVLRPGSEVFPR